MINPNKTKITVNGREIEPCGELPETKFNPKPDSFETKFKNLAESLKGNVFNPPKKDSLGDDEKA